MKRLAFLLMLFSLGSRPAWAEEIRIRVVDPQDKVIVGAAVAIRSQGKLLSKQTDEKGELAAQVAMPAEIRVTAAGFDPSDRSWI